MKDANPGGEIVLYQTSDESTRIEVRLQEESVWLTQKQMAELFQKDVRTVNEHLQNVFAEGELVEDSVIRKFRITAADGKSYETQHYNLEAIIADRADAKKPNMGLTTWKGAVVRKGDVTVAKNYLGEEEITELNRIVTMFLDYAEDQANRRKQVFMRDWRAKLDEFLRFNERKVLRDAGGVSREDADRLAHKEYAAFEERRRVELEAKGEKEVTDSLKALEAKAKKVAQSKPKKPDGK